MQLAFPSAQPGSRVCASRKKRRGLARPLSAGLPIFGEGEVRMQPGGFQMSQEASTRFNPKAKLIFVHGADPHVISAKSTRIIDRSWTQINDRGW
jgi:hypothetical protein